MIYYVVKDSVHCATAKLSHNGLTTYDIMIYYVVKDSVHCATAKLSHNGLTDIILGSL